MPRPRLWPADRQTKTRPAAVTETGCSDGQVPLNLGHVVFTLQTWGAFEVLGAQTFEFLQLGVCIWEMEPLEDRPPILLDVECPLERVCLLHLLIQPEPLGKVSSAVELGQRLLEPCDGVDRHGPDWPRRARSNGAAALTT